MFLEKKYLLDKNISSVWEIVSDIEKFSAFIPDLEKREIKDKKRFIIYVRPKLSFITGGLSIDCRIEKMENHEGKLLIEGNGLGCSFSGFSEIKLSAKGKKSLLHWKAEVTMAGLLKHVPKSLVRATAFFLADGIMAKIG